MRAGNRTQVVDQGDRAGHAGAEADAVIRPRHIIIHRFRDGDDPETFLVKPHAITECVIPADGNEGINAKKIQVLEDFRRQVVALFIISISQMQRNILQLNPGGIRTRCMQEGAAGPTGLVDDIFS